MASTVNAARGEAYGLLDGRLKGGGGRGRHEHMLRSQQLAEAVYRRFQLGPRAWKLKHCRWLMQVAVTRLSESHQYNHWLTLRLIIEARGKHHWIPLLAGPWCRRTGKVGPLATGRPRKRRVSAKPEC
jgi:hypothetical protein